MPSVQSKDFLECFSKNTHGATGPQVTWEAPAGLSRLQTTPAAYVRSSTEESVTGAFELGTEQRGPVTELGFPTVNPGEWPSVPTALSLGWHH